MHLSVCSSSSKRGTVFKATLHSEVIYQDLCTINQTRLQTNCDNLGKFESFFSKSYENRVGEVTTSNCATNIPTNVHIQHVFTYYLNNEDA